MADEEPEQAVLALGVFAGLFGVRGDHAIDDFPQLDLVGDLLHATALDDREHYEWYLDQVRVSKALLYGAFERLGVRHWPSEANFVLADFGDAAQRVVEGLAARHVFVRDRSRDPACRGCVRITAGVVEHTTACIAALEEVLCAADS